MDLNVGNVIGLLINGEWRDQNFTDEIAFSQYGGELEEQKIEYKGIVIQLINLRAIQNIHYYVAPWLDANIVVSRIEQLPNEEAEEVFSQLAVLNERAYGKEYFDYFIKNKLSLSNDPGFDPLFAEGPKTLGYAAFIEMEVYYLNGFIK